MAQNVICRAPPSRPWSPAIAALTDGPEAQDQVEKMAFALFRTERKGPAIWMQLLEHLNATSVFDTTLGSGQCARACMQAGISYSCVAKSAEHCSWMSFTPTLESASTSASVCVYVFRVMDGLGLRARLVKLMPHKKQVGAAVM